MKWFAKISAVTSASYQVALTEYGRVLNKQATTGAANTFEKAGIAEASTAGATDKRECANMGNEWRPLGEKDKYGRINPFQDPQRGRIQIITTTTSGANSVGPTTGNIQANILINLSGPTSIMGRGLKVFTATETATPLDKIDDNLASGAKSLTDATTTGFAAHACCVIGEDEPPTSTSHYHYGYGGYGYGGYGGHSYGHGHTNQEHSHDSGHGYGIGKHTHHGAGHSTYSVTGSDPVGHSGYQTPSHSHGTSVTHQHPVSAGSGDHNHYGSKSHGHSSSHSHGYKAPSYSSSKSHSHGDQSDYFGGNSMFGGFKMPTPRYQSRRSSYRY